MSTLTYAALTTKREEAQAGTSTSGSPPGLKTYVDALAALVPAEVLTLHALILPITTKIDEATKTTKITAPDTLCWAFWGLLALSALLYAVARLMAKKWDRLDWLRTAIPPLAFTGWTMLQRTTAFDSAFSNVPEAARTVGGLFLGVILGLLASALAYKADQKQV